MAKRPPVPRRRPRKPAARLLPVGDPAPRPPAAWPAAARRRGGWIGRAVLAAFVVLGLAPVALTAAYRVVPPPVTLLMIERRLQGFGLDQRWRPLSEISPSLAQAVIAAEDARFCTHHGFDVQAMRAAQAHNRAHPARLRGGSTISQQTAKNVFLWPGRSYLRKGMEAYFTVLIEALWGKRRILEVYLNVVEWGPGVYGAEAAAIHDFGHDAGDLTPQEAARLAAVLPDPLKWRAVEPGRYVVRRSRRITAGALTVRDEGLAACLRRM